MCKFNYYYLGRKKSCKKDASKLHFQKCVY